MARRWPRKGCLQQKANDQAHAGALFSFAASFDDVVIALLIAGPDQRTLPREMFSGLRDSMTPALTAVATLMIVFSTGLFLLMQSLQRRGRRVLKRVA